MSITIVAGANVKDVVMVKVVGTLTGKVTDSVSGANLAGVDCNLGGVHATTAADGTYSFTNITPGTYPLSFTLAGYTTVNV